MPVEVGDTIEAPPGEFDPELAALAGERADGAARRHRVAQRARAARSSSCSTSTHLQGAEIGRILGVSESRVSQILARHPPHAEGADRRVRLGQHAASAARRVTPPRGPTPAPAPCLGADFAAPCRAAVLGRPSRHVVAHACARRGCCPARLPRPRLIPAGGHLLIPRGGQLTSRCARRSGAGAGANCDEAAHEMPAWQRRQRPTGGASCVDARGRARRRRGGRAHEDRRDRGRHRRGGCRGARPSLGGGVEAPLGRHDVRDAEAELLVDRDDLAAGDAAGR